MTTVVEEPKPRVYVKVESSVTVVKVALLVGRAPVLTGATSEDEKPVPVGAAPELSEAVG